MSTPPACSRRRAPLVAAEIVTQDGTRIRRFVCQSCQGAPPRRRLPLSRSSGITSMGVHLPRLFASLAAGARFAGGVFSSLVSHVLARNLPPFLRGLSVLDVLTVLSAFAPFLGALALREFKS